MVRATPSGSIGAPAAAGDAMLRPAPVVAEQCERETALQDAAREAFVAPRVAVIEDDSVVRHELTQVLAGAGYRVNAVADGENGLHAVHEHQPDLLILSLAVPRLDAFELLRRLRADHRTATLPVLAMTERTSFDHRMRAFDAGADDVILKPCHPLELLARIRGPLRRHASRAGCYAPPRFGRREAV